MATLELRDPFNGRADLDAHVLRHASDRFREDPLRVLRGMQLAVTIQVDRRAGDGCSLQDPDA